MQSQNDSTPPLQTATRRVHETDEQATQPLAAVLPDNPMGIVAMLASRGEVANLEKWMDMQERHERNNAEVEFADALAEFQRLCPPVEKSREATPSGSFKGYRYASYDNVMATVRPVLGTCGLSVSFDTEQSDGKGLSLTVIVKKGIHEHRTKFVCPIPAGLSVNDAQKYGAAMSYAKRYALCAALNIVVTDEDVDAANLRDSTAFITPEQVKELHGLIEQTKPDMAAFFKFAGAETLDTIPASKFALLRKGLADKLAKAGAK